MPPMTTLARRVVAVASILAFHVPFAAALAAPATATLTGTVYAGDVKTPLAGATVVVTGAAGKILASEPTGADGSFTVDAIPAGSCHVTLQTADGRFPVATPVSLAPGQTRSVHVALKGRSDQDEKNKKKGAAATGEGRGTGAMIAVLIGVLAAGAAAISYGNDHNQQPATSPSTPN